MPLTAKKYINGMSFLCQLQVLHFETSLSGLSIYLPIEPSSIVASIAHHFSLNLIQVYNYLPLISHIPFFFFSLPHKGRAIENSKKCSASVAAAHRGFAGGCKPTDDEIEGPQHYAAKIAAIEAADVSIFQSVVMVLSQ